MKLIARASKGSVRHCEGQSNLDKTEILHFVQNDNCLIFVMLSGAKHPGNTGIASSLAMTSLLYNHILNF